MRVEGKELALRTTRKDYRAEASEVIFSLSVPNQLLFQWHRMVHEPRDYILLLNSSIADKAVAIQSDDSAGGLRSQVATVTSGKREALLGRYAHIPVYRGSTVSPQPLLEEVDSLRIELADTLVEMADRQEEITTFKEVMAKMAIERAVVMNKGKTVEESSEWHRRRKLSHFHSVTEAALWFAESFSLVPDQLNTHTATWRGHVSNHSPSPPGSQMCSTMSSHR